MIINARFSIVFMAGRIMTACDVGTSTIQTVVAEQKRGEEGLRILGVALSPSAGIRRGAVIDLEDAIASIRASKEDAERSSGVRIKSTWASVGGTHVSVSSSRGVVAVSRADGEISPEDVRRAIGAAETFVPKNPNKEILHIIPRDFKVDQESGIKDPVGMHGVRLEADALIVECSSGFLKNLLKCIEHAGMSVEDYVFAPLAASEAVLTKRQKELGVMLLDIGGGTANFIIFEEGVPIHAGVVPIGGNHITNDIAIGFKTHVDVAERIKRGFGSCIPEECAKRDVIKLAEFVSDDPSVYPRRELAEIIGARLCDVFELAQKELKRINRKQLLPAGIVLVGGTSLVPGIAELAKRRISLPAALAAPHTNEAIDERIAPMFATVLGTLRWAYAHTDASRIPWTMHAAGGESGFLKWLKSLLP